jgi:hypothetical protein
MSRWARPGTAKRASNRRVRASKRTTSRSDSRVIQTFSPSVAMLDAPWPITGNGRRSWLSTSIQTIRGRSWETIQTPPPATTSPSGRNPTPA